MAGGILPRGIAERVERKLTPEAERPRPRDPVAYVNDDLSEFTWSHQVAVMRSVVEHRMTAWAACHGPGKSFTASRLAAWWIAAHPIGDAIVVTTAPSGDQVRKILWAEIRKAHARAGLPGHVTDAAVPEWKIDGQVVAFGRKPQDYADPQQAMTQFQGIHRRYVLFILDEATGVPGWLWNAAMSALTNDSARILAIGNPDDPTTQFEKVCRPGSGWHVFHTSIYETPNFTGEYVPEELREMLPGHEWERAQKKAWGATSAMWTSKGLGQFPDVADDVVITPRMIREAQARSLPGLVRGRYALDVARHGTDESCIYRNRGGVIRLVTLPVDLPAIDERGQPDPLRGEPAAWRGADLTVTQGRLRALLDLQGGTEPDAIEATIDVVGLGYGVYDPLRRKGYNVKPFSGGEQALEPTRFVNRRTEAWWMAREALEAGLWDLDPDDDLLAAQLQQPKWRVDAGKRIRLETKEEMKKRGIDSPDRADTAVMAWYEGLDRVGDPGTVLPDDDERRTQTSHTADLLDARW